MHELGTSSASFSWSSPFPYQSEKEDSFICRLHLSFKNFLTAGLCVLPITNYLWCTTLSKAFWNSKLMATPVVCTSHHSRNNFNVLSVSLLCKFHPDVPENMVTISDSFLSSSLIKETNKPSGLKKNTNLLTPVSASLLDSLLVWTCGGLFHLLSTANILGEAPVVIYPNKSQSLQWMRSRYKNAKCFTEHKVNKEE